MKNKVLSLFAFAVAGVAMWAQSAGITNITVTFSATPTFTTTAGVTNFDLTLTGNVTSSTFSSAAVGIGSVNICQDGTGSRTLVWPVNFVGFPTITSTASACTRVGWKYDGTNVTAVYGSGPVGATGATGPTGPTGASGGGTGTINSGTTGQVAAYTGAGTTVGGVGPGTATTVLHGNASGQPSYSATVLTTDVSGILPVANGGTNNAFFTVSGPATSAKTYTFPNANATISQTIANGTSTLGTSAISANSCATAVTTTATGTATTDVIEWTPNADISAVTGYAVASTDTLKIYPYPSSNNVNFKVCNQSGSSVTPGAVTLNWRVAR